MPRIMVLLLLLGGCAAEHELFNDHPIAVIGTVGVFAFTIGGLASGQ